MPINIDYTCAIDSRLTLPKIFSLTFLVISHDNSSLEEEVYEYDLEEHHPQISDLGSTFTEVRQYFESEHILDCKDCRDLYIEIYPLIYTMKEGRRQAQLLHFVQEELNRLSL